MTKTIVFGIFTLIAGSLAANTVSAQIQWTPEQKEIWKTETIMDSLSINGHFPAIASYIDDDYQGWRNDYAVPRSKTARLKLSKYAVSQGSKVDFYESTPVAIWVKGNYAYVDYYYNIITENKSGTKKRSHGRWMDVFMKENGRWILVGDHGGRDPD